MTEDLPRLPERQFVTDLRVFQYHSSIVQRDAIGTSIRMLHRKLRFSGIQSFIFCSDKSFDRSFDGLMPAKSVMQNQWRSEDLLIVHYSFLDADFDRIMALPVQKILVYHNVTPSKFFKQSEMEWLVGACEQSIAQISSVRSGFIAAVGVSQFNCNDLARLNHPGAEAIPVFYDVNAFADSHFDRQAYFDLKTSGAINLLFVGRFVPNKRHDLLIWLLSEAKSLGGRRVNLHLVGKVWHQGYLLEVLKLAADLDVLASVQIHVDCPMDRLKSLFVAADAFVSMSEHEGFMVPVLEAFAVGCPVIAAATAAVGETMGGAGLAIPSSDPTLAAGLVHLLQMDRDLRLQVISKQAARVLEFHPDRTFLKWINLLNRFVPIERAVQ